MWHFYIIYSKTKNRFYIGHTENIKTRLKKHNTNHKGFTGKVNDWKIVYTEVYTTKPEAYARERQVKSWKSRKAIKKLINQNKQ
jgi:putative endonuclease